MKGFYIEVTNNLLDPKHREAMGEAVWLFMFFLDRMTSINEEGVGKVLGGKPIKFEEVKIELGITERTYTRWMAVLKKYGYVNVQRTAYGLAVSVNKAKKQFGRYAKNGGTDTPKMADEIGQVGGSIYTNTVDSISKTGIATQSAAGKEIAEVIDLFKAVNPSIGKYFGNKTQRAATERLLKVYGREKLEVIIKSLPQINAQPFWKKSTTPLQLENNLPEYKAKRDEKKNKVEGKDRMAFMPESK